MVTTVNGDLLMKRKTYITDLDEYLKGCEDDLGKLFERVRWTPQHFFEQDSEKIPCSYNVNHKLPRNSQEKHERLCKWLQLGYKSHELANVPESSSFFYEKTNIMTIKLEKNNIQSILKEFHRNNGTVSVNYEREVPQTLEIQQRDYSVDERRAIYDYVVRVAKEFQRMQSLPEDTLLTTDFETLIKKAAKGKELNEPSSETEKWAAMRDYKRRRQSYRAKNVHITKKTYTEIIREVIHNQVELLQALLKDSSEVESTGVQSSKRNDRHYHSSSRREDDRDRSRKSKSDNKKSSYDKHEARYRDGEKSSRGSSDYKYRDKNTSDTRKESKKSDKNYSEISSAPKDVSLTESKSSIKDMQEVKEDTFRGCEQTRETTVIGDYVLPESRYKRPLSADEDTEDTEDAGLKYKQKHKKSKKHKKHKHRSEKHDK